MSTLSRLRESLEAALVEEPDDLATHMAYADHLSESSDPRGEFIRIQLALERENLSTAQRQDLRDRERELLDAHEREWLGELAPLLLGTPEEQRALFASEMRDPDRLEYTTQKMHFRHAWARGWLDRFECHNISVEMVRKLGRAPLARLLRAFVARGWEPAEVFRYTDGPDLPPPKYAGGNRYFHPGEVLAQYPAVRNLRIFQYGEEVDPEEREYAAGTQYEQLASLLEQMLRLEELHIFGHVYGWSDMGQEMHRMLSLPTLTNLRIYQHYHATTYALEPLATNPALGKLTHLLLFPHSFSRSFNPAWIDTEDYIAPERMHALHRDNVRLVLNSPHLSSLTHLQLRCCSGGDGMIEDIIASGILKRLKMLDLRHGHVSDVGARLLADCPDTRNLEVLDLINNRLGPEGIAALEAAGVAVRAEQQQTPPFDDERILYYGDSE
jgi:uncharacterized protein (TIGR02996 family)